MAKPYKFIQIFLFLASFTFITSCNGQEKTGSSEKPSVPALMNKADTDPYFVETQNITTSYGPQSITRNMLQSNKGDIWLASWEGIMRYDGNNFTNFTNKAGLRRFHAFAALEDHKGNLWFTTIGAGVYRFDGNSFTNFTTRDGLPNDRVTYIYEDRSGNIWFGTEGGASRYDGRTFRNFTTEDGLPNNDVNAIIEDQTGKFWIGTRGEACLYDGKNFTRFTTTEGKPFENVRSIKEDRNGHIWLGGNDGLWRYDGSNYTNLTTDFVGYIYEDKAGTIWTSTDHKKTGDWVLARYSPPLPPTKEMVVSLVEPKNGMLFGILEDNSGNIWFGTLQGVCRYDGNTFDYFRTKKTTE